MSGRLGRGDRIFAGELLVDLGAAEVLREIVDLDDVPAQRFLVLPAGALFAGNDVLLLRHDGRLDAGAGDEPAALHGLAQLLLDRLAGDGGEEGLLEDA